EALRREYSIRRALGDRAAAGAAFANAAALAPGDAWVKEERSRLELEALRAAGDSERILERLPGDAGALRDLIAAKRKTRPDEALALSERLEKALAKDTPAA